MSLSEQQQIDLFVQRNSAKKKLKDFDYWSAQPGSSLAGVICGVPETHGCLVIRDRDGCVRKVGNFRYVVGALKMQNADIGDFIEISCDEFTEFQGRNVPVLQIDIQHA